MPRADDGRWAGGTAVRPSPLPDALPSRGTMPGAAGSFRAAREVGQRVRAEDAARRDGLGAAHRPAHRSGRPHRALSPRSSRPPPPRRTEPPGPPPPRPVPKRSPASSARPRRRWRRRDRPVCREAARAFHAAVGSIRRCRGVASASPGSLRPQADGRRRGERARSRRWRGRSARGASGPRPARSWRRRRRPCERLMEDQSAFRNDLMRAIGSSGHSSGVWWPQPAPSPPAP